MISSLQQLAHDNSLLKREVGMFPDLLKQSIKQAGKAVGDVVVLTMPTV